MDLWQERDFLDPHNDFTTDVLLIAMIAGSEHEERSPYRGGATVPPAFRQSPYEEELESWKKATMKADPKLVFSFFANEKDIKGSDFLDSRDYIGPYRPDTRGMLASMCHIRRDYAKAAGLRF